MVVVVVRVEARVQVHQCITYVVWPALLERLTFNTGFSQPTLEAAWPSLLQQLTFEWAFNQPVNGFEWPSSFSATHLRLALSQGNHVAWPASVQELTFWGHFDEPTRSISAMTIWFAWGTGGSVGLLGMMVLWRAWKLKPERTGDRGSVRANRESSEAMNGAFADNRGQRPESSHEFWP